MVAGNNENIFQDNFKKHKETIVNFIWRAIQIVGKQGVTFLIFLLCAKILDPLHFGIYNYIFSLIFMFALFSDFGLSITVSRYTAEYNATGDSSLGKLVYNSIALMVVVSVLACVIVIFFRQNIKYFEYLVYCLPMLLFVPLTSLYDGLYRGMKRFRELSLINFIIGVLFLPFMYMCVTTWGIIGAIIAQNVFYFLLFAAFAALSFRVKLRPVFVFDRELIMKVVKYSLLVGLSNVGLFLYTRADILVLGRFNLIEEIGYYEVVNRFFMILIFPAQILATVVAPKIAGIFVQKKNDEIKKNYFRDLLVLFVLGVFFAAIFYLIMEDVFGILFKNYSTTILVTLMGMLLFLIPLRYFSTYTTIGYITPSGNVIILTISILVFGVINVLLDYALIPLYGLTGVIYATLISQLMFMLTKDYSFYHFVIKRL